MKKSGKNHHPSKVAETPRPTARSRSSNATQENTKLGAINMIAAAFCFAFAPAIARSASSEMNVLALVFWSNLWMFLFISAWTILRGEIGDLRTRKAPLHVLRSLLTYGAIVAYFFAVTRIEFANAVILQSMGPIFVPVLMYLVFRRVSDRFVWIGVAVSFVGVVLIVRPSGLAISIGETAALLAALAGAAAALVVWSLSTTETPARQMFYFSFFAWLLSVLPLPWVWQLPDVQTMFQIILVALFTLIGQSLYSTALLHAAPDKVHTWIYMSLVFAAVIGYVAWGEPVYTITIAGAGLVVVGAFLTARSSAEPSSEK